MNTIKQITKYKTTDGLEFKSRECAEVWQRTIDCLEEVEQRVLGDRPESTGWYNGRLGYIQHHTDARDTVIRALKDAGATRDSRGAMGRLLSRAHCIDNQGREWGQQYYANHPDQASDTCYEDRR